MTDPRPATILVAEDEFASLEILVMMLEAEGYQVVATSDGEEALERLRAQPVDLLLTDYMMPKLDGLELCDRMRADPDLAHIPVVLMSASIRATRTPSPPIVARLDKPLLFDVLLEVIRKALAAAPRR